MDKKSDSECLYRRRSCSLGTTVKIIVYAILYLHYTKTNRTKNKCHTNCILSSTNRVNIIKYTKMNSNLQHGNYITYKM